MSRAPRATSDEVRRRMSRQAGVGTAPELLVRRELHRRGLRYRVDYAPLDSNRRRRADIVFTRQRVAVFVDGCYWHRCPEHGTVPKSNRSWWLAKLDRNVARDRATDQELRDAGWTVLRFWEHHDPVAAADEIERAVNAPGRPS